MGAKVRTLTKLAESLGVDEADLDAAEDSVDPKATTIVGDGAAFLSDFVEEMKASGFVARLIEKHGVTGRLTVAPAG
mgnify:CR=1 FL=1